MQLVNARFGAKFKSKFRSMRNFNRLGIGAPTPSHGNFAGFYTSGRLRTFNNELRRMEIKALDDIGDVPTAHHKTMPVRLRITDVTKYVPEIELEEVFEEL